MFNLSEKLTQELFKKQLISEEQNQEIKDYRSKNIFSINAELLFLLYLSVILFTSGIGIFIYKNIDSIGHLALLAVNFVLMIICYVVCFKKSKGYSPTQISFTNPIHDYVLLTGSILFSVFLGYANYQFHIFGSDYQWVSLISAIIYFFTAYYFDNKAVLSMAITALAAFVGISVTPKMLINNFNDNLELIYSGIILGSCLITASEYLSKTKIKQHFHFVYSSITIHLLGICIISGTITKHWLAFLLISLAFTYYFIQSSYKQRAASVFAFTLIYEYITLNILFWRLINYLNLNDLVTLMAYLNFIINIVAIFVFIKMVRNFKKKTNDSLR